MRAGEIVAEPLRNFGIPVERDHIARLFEEVGLRPDQMENFPHEFSGGQRQRLVIAKALALQPSVIVCDEAVSALDVSGYFGIAYLLFAHDVRVVEQISDRIAVMYLGQIVEMAEKRALFERPMHPYTQALLAAVPVPDPEIRREQKIISGDVPSPLLPPRGCRFHTRCPLAFARCRTEAPAYREVEPGHFSACHLNDPAEPVTGPEPAAGATLGCSAAPL
jgi:peptide/nickel transport system ATP-binding protein/oligopeptide transport system ATP-binding protein